MGSSGRRRIFVVDTDCLRTGDRCMSFFYEQTGIVSPWYSPTAVGRWPPISTAGVSGGGELMRAGQEDRAIPAAPTTTESDHAADRAR